MVENKRKVLEEARGIKTFLKKVIKTKFKK